MKIGVNGIAGRIGKFTAYELVSLGEKVGVVNDLASTDDIVESLRHKDSVHGSLEWVVERVSDELISINGDEVKVYHKRDPAEIEWDKEVYAVDECAGPFTKREDSERHFTSNPNLKTVLISQVGKGDMKMLVMGVNHVDYEKGTEKDKVISNASCTTKALAMPLKVLIDAGITIYGVLMDTTHAATNTQKPLDFMSTYGLLDTIQSAKTGAAIATGKVISQLEAKMDGFAMRVPTRDGSFANIYFVAEVSELSVEYINSVFKNALNEQKYFGRLDVFDGKEIATPDIVGNTASSVIALQKTNLIKLPFKNDPTKELALIGIVSGYDNEKGPAKDLALLTQYVMHQWQ